MEFLPKSTNTPTAASLCAAASSEKLMVAMPDEVLLPQWPFTLSERLAISSWIIF